MISEIANIIQEKNSFLILPHIKLDGDAIGSSLALCKALKKLGKKSKILYLDFIPYDLKFLEFEDYLINDLSVINKDDYDCTISIDSSDVSRFEDRKSVLSSMIINIDHHVTNIYYGDYNLIDTGASSTGEIIFDLINELKIEMDESIAIDIYTAISTDTGNFMYCNTTKKTHQIVTKLFDYGIKIADINVHLYQNKPIEKFMFDAKVFTKVEYFYSNRLAIVLIDQKFMRDENCEDTDNIVEALRDIYGVDVSVLILETKDVCRVSMRSKSLIDVAKIATKHGGGGHTNAAGFSVELSINETKKLLLEEYSFLDERLS